jgi:3-hydroxyisobutyrate dehydrogenase-like beta-hydroxyacid dehydrogenase
MGSRMAQALLGAGHEVLARDVSPEAAARAQALGARVLPSPAAVAEEAEVVLLSLGMPADVAQVVAGDDGLLSRARAGLVIVDLSTVDPSSTRRMAALAAERGVGYLDAPVLGRPQGCGKWTLPTGGPAEALEKARPALEPLARRIVHVGESGHGNVVKLLNNLMFGAINAVTAEIMAICAKTGMSPAVLFSCIAESGAASVSNLFLELGPKMLNRDYSPLFAIDLLHKDNALALQMAREHGATPILSSTTQLLNELARAQGLGAEDTSALVKVYELLAKTEVKGQSGS